MKKAHYTVCLTNEEVSKLNAELYLLLEYHEESFAQNVYQIYSYNFMEMKVDVKVQVFL